MRDKLGANAHPLYLAIGAEENFRGLVDLVKMVALTFMTNLMNQVFVLLLRIYLPICLAKLVNTGKH